MATLACLLACLHGVWARRRFSLTLHKRYAECPSLVFWCETFWEELLSWTSFSPLSVSLSLSLSLSLSFFRQGNGVEDCSPTPRASAPPTVAGGHGGKRLCWQGPQPSRAKYLEKRDEGGTPANWKHASVRKEGNSLTASKEKEVRELKKSTAMCGGRLRRPVLCYSLVCG